jgi:hypothetical protein
VTSRLFAAVAEARLPDVAPVEADLSGVLADIAALEASLADLARDHYTDRLITRAEYFAARNAIVERVDGLRSRITATPAPRFDLTDLEARWEHMQLAEQRAILAAFVECVVVLPAVKGRNFFDPSLIEVRWRG